MEAIFSRNAARSDIPSAARAFSKACDANSSLAGRFGVALRRRRRGSRPGLFSSLDFESRFGIPEAENV
jgi:hypothetical protein